ncbi:class I SAM-dependent methyltransferase [Planctomycetota bacterium]
MTDTITQTKLPTALLEPFWSEHKTVAWISELTGTPENIVTERLRAEYDYQGTNVMRHFEDSGLEPYKWSSQLEQFYDQTDAFLYELAIWNCNRAKRSARKWLARYLQRCTEKSANILCIGDGLGVDSAYLDLLGYDVTYFEVSGYTQAFAKKLFAECNADVTILTDQNRIPSSAYDVVICLDVLEHVPDPHSFVETLVSYLRDDACLIISAPFYMIHPSNPTHLRYNRKHSGDLSLYRTHNLTLVDGKFNWNPLVFAKAADYKTKHPKNILNLIAIKLVGLYLAIGRFSTLPFCWIDTYRHKRRRWFSR